MQQKSKPHVALQLLAFLRTSRFCSAVAVPSFKRNGDPSSHFRIHDAMIEEPTGAVAYPHWSGRVDFALLSEDVPDELMSHQSVTQLAQKKYSVSCKITDDSSRAVAEELLFLALEKLRAKKAAW